MSVYTLVDQPQLEAFLTRYAVGTLVDYKGISDGIENTNYFVTTSEGEFVLTLFESTHPEELPYFLKLMAFTADHGVPSACPVIDQKGCYLQTLNNKPTALVKRLTGKVELSPNVEQCYILGKTLGHFHTISPNFPEYRANDRGPNWWKQTAERVLPCLSIDDANLLSDEIQFQSDYKHLTLPKGVIHADLFRDNALFDGDRLCGLIDFYYACNDILIYDLAVVVNDWCSMEDGKLENERMLAMLEGYQEIRPLSQKEKQAWPLMLRAAALRFWLSRLQDLHFPREGEIVQIKDPNVFRNILLSRIIAQPIQ